MSAWRPGSSLSRSWRRLRSWRPGFRWPRLREHERAWRQALGIFAAIILVTGADVLLAVLLGGLQHGIAQVRRQRRKRLLADAHRLRHGHR